jgi:hypothetical protein
MAEMNSGMRRLRRVCTPTGNALSVMRTPTGFELQSLFVIRHQVKSFTPEDATESLAANEADDAKQNYLSTGEIVETVENYRQKTERPLIRWFWIRVPGGLPNASGRVAQFPDQSNELRYQNDGPDVSRSAKWFNVDSRQSVHRGTFAPRRTE